MRNPRLMKFLISILTLGLLSLGTSIQAADPQDAENSITLEKTVQFQDPQGEEVLVAPGTYTLTAKKESLYLTNNKSKVSVTIEANENSHKAKILTPAAASIPGEEGALANTHVLSLFLPEGQALQAIGTYLGIQSRGIPADTDLSGGTTTITFEKAVHFIAPDGSPVVAEPGTYTAEVAQDWIRLIPGEERHNALLIEAQKGTNETEVEDLVAFSLPGSTEKELDLHHVMLLVPNGQSLEATGSYSGIQPRDIFKHLFRHVKRHVHRAVKHHKRNIRAAAIKKAKAIAKQARKSKAARLRALKIKQVALKAKRAAEHAARVAAAKAKQIAQKAARLAKIQACKMTVGLIKGGKAVAGFMKNLIPSAKSKTKGAQNRFKKDKGFHDQLIAKVTRNLQAHKAKIPELKRVAQFMNRSKNKKKLESIFSASHFCEDSIGSMDKQLKRIGIAPKFAMVRSRGANSEHFYMGYQLTFGIGAGAGLQVGLMGVTDFIGNGGKYWFIGPQAITNASVGVTAEVTFFPKVSLNSFKGWGAGVGISAGPPTKIVSGAVDVMLDEKVKEFQGFGFGPGVGLGVIPIDAAFSYTHSWKY